MSDKYSEERSFPKVPSCGSSKLSLVFNGYDLQIIGTKPFVMFPAVSGRPANNGKFDYSVDRQKIPNNGPIPAGKY
jgi:hypothetical protein